jgi:hypothetical protein
LRERLAHQEWQPLELQGKMIELDTSTPLDVESLMAMVRQ